MAFFELAGVSKGYGAGKTRTEVLADIDVEASEVVVTVHWQGGVHTELRLPRRRRGQSSIQTAKPTIGTQTDPRYRRRTSAI